MTVKVNYILDAQNNRKNYFETDIPIFFENLTKKHQRYGEIIKKYENSQKPAKSWMFMKMIENLILIFLTTKF